MIPYCFFRTMNQRIKTLYKQLSFIAYCALLSLIAMFGASLQSDFKIDKRSISKNQNNGQFEDATINAYDSTTNLLYRLSSPIIYYRRSTGFEFEQPKFSYQTPAKVPLQLSAAKGSMGNNSALIELLGDVNLFHINPDNSMPEYLYTDDATVDLNRKIAYTDSKATFRRHKRITEGTGMVVDLEAQTIKLKSNIKVLNVR